MKRSLILLIIFVFLLVVAKSEYTKYCESKPDRCKKEKLDYEKDGVPKEDKDW